MVLDKKTGAIKINGYDIEIYKNAAADIVLKQTDPYQEESIIVIGKEQLKAVISALKTQKKPGRL
jgi:hypothetical protein